MANKDHLAVLKQGANAWNQWRANNPGIKPDLGFSNLSRANLSGLDLSATPFTALNFKFVKRSPVLILQ